MKTIHVRFVKRASAVAVQSALLAMAMVPAAFAADAADPAVLDLTRPASTLELGIGYVSQDSFKFGEYNGLNRKGAYGIGAFDVFGGAPYDSASAFRWRVLGSNLGLENRNIGAEVGTQGVFRLRYSYDELRRNQYDGYQTFYSGAGGTTLSIPAFADVPLSSRLSSTANANSALANWQNIQAPYATAACAGIGGVPSAACAGPGFRIPAAMRDFDVSTKRKKHELDYTQELTPDVQLKASFRHEDKDGTKLTGVAFGGPARGVLVPEPIQFTTDQFRASIGWTGARSHLTIGYIGSIFKNDTNLWLVENPFNGNLLQPDLNNFAHMSGAPDNEMHQLHLDGSYTFMPGTRLVLTGNYQRLTQNESFVPVSSTWRLPETSPNAKVINTNFTATLTSRPMRDLSLLAQYKYEDRDNRTPSLNFIVSGGEAAGTTNLFTNRPLDFRTNQVTLEGDYTLARRQSIKLGYDYRQVERTVDAEPPPPAEIESPFSVEKTREHTLRGEYRNTFSPAVSGRLSYAHSWRRGSEYEIEELLPTPTVAPFPAADPLLPEFRQIWLADRDRDRVKAVVNAQPNEQLGIQGGVDYMRDHYPHSPFGVKNVDAFVFNLDASYAATQTLALNAFYTYEDRKSNIDSLVIGRGNATTILDRPAFTNPCTGYFAAAGHLPSDLGTDPCRQWAESQSDRVHTFGIGAKMTGFINERFDLVADLSYSRARTPISVSGGAYFGNGSTAAAPAFNNIFIAAQDFPDIKSEYIQLRLNGTYSLDAKSAVRLLYIFGHLKSSDWQWDAYTNSPLGVLAIPVYPGVGITSPNYNVNVFGISYIYRFR